jgi:hypothetical protein
VNLTGFYTEQRDLPVSYASLARPGTFAVASLNPTVWGVEFEGTLRVVDGLTANLSVGWLDYKFADFGSLPVEVRPSVGPNLRFAPHWTSKFGLDYGTTFASGWGIRLSNNYAYSSKQFTNTANTAAGISEERLLVDAALTIDAPDKRYAISISCANCTNKTYVGNSLDFGGVRGGGLPVSLVFPGDPRTWQVAVRANF